MNITLTLGETCMLFIVIALFILLLYCISLVRHLIPSIKSLAKVMKDVEVITDCAAKSTQSAETIVSDVMDVTSTVVASVKGHTSILGQLSSIAAAIKTIVTLLSDKDKHSEENCKPSESENCSEQTCGNQK